MIQSPRCPRCAADLWAGLTECPNCHLAWNSPIAQPPPVYRQDRGSSVSQGFGFGVGCLLLFLFILLFLFLGCGYILNSAGQALH